MTNLLGMLRLIVLGNEVCPYVATRVYLIPEALLRHWPLDPPMRERERKRAPRGGVSATAGIINNKGIGTGD